jgi:hypothetical protein
MSETKDPDPTPRSSIVGWRIGFGAIGATGVGYGAALLLSRPNLNRPWQVAKWAIGTDLVTDGVLIPAAMIGGWLITRFVSPRARRYMQGALIAAAGVTVVALPLIHRRGDAQPGQGLLLQNYTKNLTILIGVIAAVTVALYALAVVRDHVRAASSETHVLPAKDRDTTGE